MKIKALFFLMFLGIISTSSVKAQDFVWKVDTTLKSETLYQTDSKGRRILDNDKVKNEFEEKLGKNPNIISQHTRPNLCSCSYDSSNQNFTIYLTKIRLSYHPNSGGSTEYELSFHKDGHIDASKWMLSNMSTSPSRRNVYQAESGRFLVNNTTQSENILGIGYIVSKSGVEYFLFDCSLSD